MNPLTYLIAHINTSKNGYNIFFLGALIIKKLRLIYRFDQTLLFSDFVLLDETQMKMCFRWHNICPRLGTGNISKRKLVFVYMFYRRKRLSSSCNYISLPKKEYIIKRKNNPNSCSQFRKLPSLRSYTFCKTDFSNYLN